MAKSKLQVNKGFAAVCSPLNLVCQFSKFSQITVSLSSENLIKVFTENIYSVLKMNFRLGFLLPLLRSSWTMATKWKEKEMMHGKGPLVGSHCPGPKCDVFPVLSLH